MDDPVTTLIAVLLLGIGSTILFGAIKNKKVFGKNGIVPTALTTGSLTDLAKVPDAYPSFKITPPNPTGAVADAVKSVWDLFTDYNRTIWNKLTGTSSTAATYTGPPDVVVQALANISKDTIIAPRIASELAKLHVILPADVANRDTTALRLLLGVADSNGHKVDADVIRDYVRRLTGESI